jgi:hypothetical protein
MSPNLQRLALLTFALLLATPLAGRGSERSELLVAKGQVAYHDGRFEEARALFREALAADEGDADAHYALGLVLLRLGRREEAAPAFERALALRPDFDAARRGLAAAHGEALEPGGERLLATGASGELERLAAARAREGRRRWAVSATTGFQYDSNVTLEPGGRFALGQGDQSDVGFVLAGGGRYDAYSGPNALVRLEYDLYQTLHPDLDDFDFRSHRVRGTGSYALRPELWAGVQGGYNHYTLGPHSYLGEPYVMPFVSVLEKTWGLTQLTYRHGAETYLSTPFHDVRDGPADGGNVSQYFYFEGARYVTVGYQFSAENPDSPAGDDYQFRSNQGYVAGGFPAWWQVVVDLMYLYRNDDYTKPNSFAAFRKTRQDNGHFLYAALTRPFGEHLSVALAYYGTWNGSNIGAFDYRRQVVAALLQVAY